MRMLVITVSLVILTTILLMLSGCARPWSHPNFTGAEADAQFKQDTYNCKVNAMDKHPLDKHMQSMRYEECMKEKGWINRRDYDGIRFETKPR